MIDFATLKGLTVPEGVVVKIEANGVVLWELQTGGKVILEVEKITSNTYAGETSYSNENFILLDIYPKTNGTVTITYGGLTKTITDTSGAAEPNAQQVFFGTLYGVSDSVETPASGMMTVTGDYVAIGQGSYAYDNKGNRNCGCVKKILDFGTVEYIPKLAFSPNLTVTSKLAGELVIPTTVKTIGDEAFSECIGLTDVTIGSGVVSIGHGAFYIFMSEAVPQSQRIIMLSETPPVLQTTVDYYINFGKVNTTDYSKIIWCPTIIVPKGCGEAYKSAEGWSTYANYIMEAS